MEGYSSELVTSWQRESCLFVGLFIFPPAMGDFVFVWVQAAHNYYFNCKNVNYLINDKIVKFFFYGNHSKSDK